MGVTWLELMDVIDVILDMVSQKADPVMVMISNIQFDCNTFIDLILS